MLKVLQIGNKAPYPANDGSSIAIFNMAKGLLACGVDLHLLTINTKKHFKSDKEVPAEFREKSHYTSVYKNTSPDSLGALLNLFSSTSYFVSRFYFKAFEKKLINILQQHTFDIIQLEGLFMGVYITTIRKHSSAKLILRAHNIEHFIWKRHIVHETSPLKKIYFKIQTARLKAFEEQVLGKVDAIVPITKKDEQDLRAMGVKKPMYTCITGVDVKAYALQDGSNKKPGTLFYFGSMDWLPNQEAATWFLDNCWDKIQSVVPEAKFIIAGRGMPLEFFHINRPNVYIVENVENSRQFYHQHEVMLVPLLSGSGLRIKIIEGMAYGKAIVSTSIGAEGIPCTHEKDILIADSAEAFTEAVIRVLKNESLRKQLENNALLLAKREFDNTQVVSALTEFYKGLLNA